MFRVTILEILKEEKQEAIYQKVADKGNERDGNAQYEYVISPIPKTIDVERKLFEQFIGILNLPAVIKAVNGL